jgi:hypothetical protein
VVQEVADTNRKEQPLAARDVYLSALVVIVLVALAAGAADWLLWLAQEPTISEFLRQHLHWYWGVVLVAGLFFVLLGLHLYFPFPDN